MKVIFENKFEINEYNSPLNVSTKSRKTFAVLDVWDQTCPLCIQFSASYFARFLNLDQNGSQRKSKAPRHGTRLKV